MNNLNRGPFPLLLTAALLAAVSGCVNLAPTYRRPAQELPPTWGDEASGVTDPQAWWRLYGDPLLDRLVAEALVANANLAAAVARIDEARAQRGFARAQQFPLFDASLGRSRTQASEMTSTPLPAGAERESDNYRATLNTSYELDLWGRLRNTRRAAHAELLASEAAAQTVRMTLVADVAQAYFSIRALDAQIAATQRSLAARSESLALQKIRYEGGAISAFEYRQLEAEALAARAQLPPLEQRRAQQETALAVLLGKSPRVIFEAALIAPNEVEAGADTPHVLTVPAELPAELLLRRPDIVAAEQRLIAANARIGAARAAYFPALSLTGFIGSEAGIASDLFSGPAAIWQAAAGITQPIWGAGRATTQTDAAHARQRQMLALYQQAIQNAFRDIRNAMVAQTKSREQLDVENQRVEALRETLRLAKLRYENGIASQLDVLDTERALLAAELSRHEALRGQRAAIADVFKALGGGWAAER